MKIDLENQMINSVGIYDENNFLVSMGKKIINR
jgi:hypothetical protein